MTGSETKTCPNCAYELRQISLFCPSCGAGVMPSIDVTLQITLQQILASVPPGKAEVLRRCAIPRWIDSAIMGVIRDREDGANQQILEQLASYSFVRSVGPGRYTYSEDVRTLLLDEWRERPDDLREVQKRLYRYFERQMGSSAEANRAMWVREVAIYDLLLASSTLASETAPPQISVGPRLLLASTLEARIERSLLRYRDLFEKAERSFRLAEAEALLVAAEEQADLLAPRIRDWLLYYRATFDHLTLKFNNSISGYQRLLKRPNLDPELRAISAIKLGDVLVEIGSWSAAIQSYHDALALPKLNNDQKAAAHVGLADAYNEVAISAGGWHIIPQQNNRLLHLIRRLGEGITMIPMLILVSILKRLGAAMPRPEILARYRNWLLARIFRASREQVEAAQKIFREQQDDYNMARCEIRLIEIDVLFGDVRSSVTRARALLEQPFAQNIYRKSRAQLTLARALLADHQLEAARIEAEEALAFFRSVGDGRWETRALNILGRVQLELGQDQAALATFRETLERAREIGSMLSRERALYELRVWHRTRPNPLPEVADLLHDEPVQRFVGRMPKFLLPYLQVGQATILPLLLLLSAAITPLINPAPGLTVDQTTLVILPAVSGYAFPLARLILIPAVIFALVGVAYALLGLLVLWRLPLSHLERNQPDVILVEPDEIVQYDSHGQEVRRMRWQEVREVINADRMLWRRPMSVFSRMFLNSGTPPVLRLDGILSWYNSLCYLVNHRLAQSGVSSQTTNLSLSLTRSLSGALLTAGLLLLIMMIGIANNLLPGVGELFEPNLFAVLQQLAYSGVLVIIPMIYWGVVAPLRLRRAFILHDRLPWVILVGGALLSLLIFFTGGKLVRIPSLAITLFISGLYLMAEAGFTLLVSNRDLRGFSLPRLIIHMVVLLLGLVLLGGSIEQAFYQSRAYIYNLQDNDQAASSDQIAAAVVGRGAWIDQSSPLEQAAALAQSSQWKQAGGLYEEILRDPQVDQTDRAIAHHNGARSRIIHQDQEPLTPEIAERILAGEDQALKLGLDKDPETRSAILETKADLYLVLNRQTEACDSLRDALRATQKTTRQQAVQKRIDSQC